MDWLPRGSSWVIERADLPKLSRKGHLLVLRDVQGSAWKYELLRATRRLIRSLDSTVIVVIKHRRLLAWVGLSSVHLNRIFQSNCEVVFLTGIELIDSRCQFVLCVRAFRVKHVSISVKSAFLAVLHLLKLALACLAVLVSVNFRNQGFKLLISLSLRLNFMLKLSLLLQENFKLLYLPRCCSDWNPDFG